MQSLNFKLENESQSPFHAYLLLSDSSKYVLDQSVQFASTISLSQNYDQDHPDIRVIESENVNTIGIENSNFNNIKLDFKSMEDEPD